MVCHFGWCYLFVTYLDFGINGLGLATCLTYTLNFILIQMYIWFTSRCKETRSCPDQHALEGIWDYLGIAFPTYISVLTRWLGYEICILVTSYVGKDEFAA